MLASSSTRMPRSGPRGPSGSTTGDSAAPRTHPTIDNGRDRGRTTARRAPDARKGTLWYRGGDPDLRSEGDEMGIRLALRYDMRAPAFGAPATELYPAAVEQCAIADAAGFQTVFLAEHHGADDGYCPSPMVLAVGDPRPDEADDRALLRAHRRAAQPVAAGRGPRRARPRLRRSHRDDPRHRLPPARVRDVRRPEVEARQGAGGDDRRAREGVERRAVRVPGHDGADPADARAEAAAADLHRWVDRGVGDPGGALRRRLHAGHAAAVRGVRRGVPAPRQAGDGRSGTEGAVVPLRHRTIPSAAGRSSART